MNDRMQAELTTWLRGFEPSGTPIALRIRTFADLRTEAERPRRRLPWLVPALSSAASLAVLLLGLGAIMALAVAGATLNGAAGQAVSPAVPDQTGTAGPNPAALLLLLVATGLAGGVVLVPRVRAVVGRLTFGTIQVTPAEPLPLKRPWRSISRWTWLLVVLTVVTIGLVIRDFSRTLEWMTAESAVYNFCIQVVTAPMALVVAWRYPRGDRSSVMLLLGVLVGLVNALVLLALIESPLSWVLGVDLCVYLILYVLPIVEIVLFAAGLACRSGVLRRPPVRLAAVAFGTAFFITMSFLFEQLSHDAGIPPDAQLELIVAGLWHWLALVSWLAILWIALSAVRIGRSWTWALVLGAGLLVVSARLLLGALQLLPDLGIGPADSVESLIAPMNLAQEWSRVAQPLAGVALLGALLGGLRPMPPHGDAVSAGVDLVSGGARRAGRGRIEPGTQG